MTCRGTRNALNNALARELLTNPDAWEFVTFDQLDEAPQAVVRWLTLPAH